MTEIDLGPNPNGCYNPRTCPCPICRRWAREEGFSVDPRREPGDRLRDPDDARDADEFGDR